MLHFVIDGLLYVVPLVFKFSSGVQMFFKVNTLFV